MEEPFDCDLCSNSFLSHIIHYCPDCGLCYCDRCWDTEHDCYDDEEDEEEQLNPAMIAGMILSGEHPGYRARNLDVAAAYGLNSGLCSIKKRMQKRKDCPMWLLNKLDEMITRSNQVIRPLIQHRDELPATIE